MVQLVVPTCFASNRTNRFLTKRTSHNLMLPGSPRGSVSLRKSSIFEVFQEGYEGDESSTTAGGNLLTVQSAIESVARATDRAHESRVEKPVRSTAVKTTGLTAAALTVARELASGLITSSGKRDVSDDVTTQADTLDSDGVPQLSPIRLSPDFIDLGMLVLILLLCRVPRQYRQLQW